MNTSFAQKVAGFQIVDNTKEKKVDILFNKKLLTSFTYPNSVSKAVLWPVNTLEGITVTRGFPLKPVLGERTDHPHHIGIWMNYESVNGIDFWNNSTAIPAAKKPLYGSIIHMEISSKKASKNSASLTVTAKWMNNSGQQFLSEKTIYDFSVVKNRFYITRTSYLSSLDKEVIFKDVKDGFFAIRVARELEMPSKEPLIFTDIHGNKTEIDPTPDKKVSGMYYNSEGETGDDVWAKTAKWVVLKGRKDHKNISLAMFDHPSNIGYPTYWHARGYGLFSLNPLGRKVFSNGKEELNFTLPPKSSQRFVYRIVLTTDDLSTEEMNRLADEFSKKVK
ncbi:MAG: PmoA family protein [Sphingobacteriales bacterium]|nr:PmoA family protein [Sphingobacteriales bacterium]